MSDEKEHFDYDYRRLVIGARVERMGGCNREWRRGGGPPETAIGRWAKRVDGNPPVSHPEGRDCPGDIRPAFITGWGYEPSQIQDAYGFSSLQADGTGQKVAIIVAYGSPTLNEDVTAFCKEFGLPPPILNVIYPGGEPTAYDAGWAFETSLDVEWVHALAPGATIDLVIAPSNLFSDLFYAILYATETLQAQVVSMSWGGSEFAGEAQYDWVFQNTGTVFIASTGDSGSGAQYPAASRVRSGCRRHVTLSSACNRDPQVP